jgi:hypothetical protein
MGDGQEEVRTRVCSLASQIDINQEGMKDMLDACLEMVEANSRELQFVAVHQEAPKEQDAVEIISALKDRPGDRHLIVVSRRQTKKLTQEDGGNLQKLAIARGLFRRRTILALSKGQLSRTRQV